MTSFLFRTILIPLIILSFWFSFEMSIIILIIYGLLEIILFRTASIKVKPTEGLELTSYEEEIFSRYYVVFKFPAASRDYSAILATIQFSAFILTPLFLFKGLFIPAIMLGFNFWLAGIIAAKFNPILYLGEDIKKGNTTYKLEYEAIQSIGRKINDFQNKQSKKHVTDILKETLRLVYSSKRVMPAHFTSVGDRNQTLCIEFEPLIAEIDYEMSAEAWGSVDNFLGITNRGIETLSKNQLNAVIKCGEDLMAGAFIIVKLGGIHLIEKMKQEIINNTHEDFRGKIEDISKVLSGKQVNNYFNHCIEFGKKQAK